MSQEILTGNLLSDGITYHAADINSAVNGATIQPGIIENRAVVTASSDYKALVSNGISLLQVTLGSIGTNTLTSGVTTNPFNISQGVQLSNILPVSASGTQNDYNPTGFDKCTMLAVTGTCTITGMQAGPTGTLKIIYNFGAGVVTVARENAGSLANNRFTYKSAAADVALQPGQCLTCIYTVGVNARWLVLCTNTNLT